MSRTGIFLSMCLSLVLLIPASGADVSAPIVVKRDGVPVLEIPTAGLRAIDIAVPGFIPWSIADYTQDIQSEYQATSRQLPWAVIGDFDGDGRSDLVLDGHTGERQYRLCLWGGADSARVAIISDEAFGPSSVPRDFVLMYRSPGVHFSNWEDDEYVSLFNDAFLAYYYGKSGGIMYWSQGEWKAFHAVD